MLTDTTSNKRIKGDALTRAPDARHYISRKSPGCLNNTPLEYIIAG